MPNNLDYITYQVCNNQKIYIDTCSLMDTDRLLNFIDCAKSIFIKNKKKIIIHSSVMAELAKFSCSNNNDKRLKSSNALEIIRLNLDLFYIEENDESKAENCFADSQLLALLLANRNKYKQLLISNDSNLTNDAFNFNSIKSFHGNRINVCYLGTLGSMYICDCAKKHLHRNHKNINESHLREQENKNIEKETIEFIQDTQATDNTTSFAEKSKFDLRSFALGSLLTGSGIGLLFTIYKKYSNVH